MQICYPKYKIKCVFLNAISVDSWMCPDVRLLQSLHSRAGVWVRAPYKEPISSCGDMENHCDTAERDELITALVYVSLSSKQLGHVWGYLGSEEVGWKILAIRLRTSSKKKSTESKTSGLRIYILYIGDSRFCLVYRLMGSSIFILFLAGVLI